MCHAVLYFNTVQLKRDGTWWHTEGEVKGKLADGVGSQYSHTTSEHGVSALLLLMHTHRLPVVDGTDIPTDLNGLACFAKRRNLVSVCVPSHFKRSLTNGMIMCTMQTKTKKWQKQIYLMYKTELGSMVVGSDYLHKCSRCWNACYWPAVTTVHCTASHAVPVHALILHVNSYDLHTKWSVLYLLHVSTHGSIIKCLTEKTQIVLLLFCMVHNNHGLCYTCVTLWLTNTITLIYRISWWKNGSPCTIYVICQYDINEYPSLQVPSWRCPD